MSTTPEPSPAKTPRRWLGPALLGSLALNLFLIALMAVPLVMGGPGRGGPALHGPMPGMFHSLKDLPRGDRQAMRDAMRDHFPEVRLHMRDMGAARTALADALAADPYDEAAARAAFDAMDGAMREMTAIGRDAMLAGFAKLTPEQRQRMAQAMREGGDRYRMHFRDRRDDGERVIIDRRDSDGESGD
jgi:Spy/CpxP family protein refolding chaperone